MFYVIGKTNAGASSWYGPYATLDDANTAAAGPDTLGTGVTSAQVVRLPLCGQRYTGLSNE